MTVSSVSMIQATSVPRAAKRHRYRLPLLAMAMAALVAALWAGLARMGWGLPASPELMAAHGPLMACGFLGTLIALERAVALQRPWGYAVPAVAGLGALAIIFRLPAAVGPALLVTASAGLVALSAVGYRLRPDLPSQVMLIGAAAWLAGNGLWLAGWALPVAAWWWLTFLVLTIAGERLEMSRLGGLTSAGRGLFMVAAGLLLAGVLVAPWGHFDGGVRLAGAGLMALGLWLLRYDIARRTVRRPGLPRFAALTLLLGYGWLVVAGVLAAALGGVNAGPAYDAMLHAAFVGFVFSAIFAHGPIVFPAITGRPISFHAAFYAAPALLNLALWLRLTGDLAASTPLRQGGGLLNAAAILLYLGTVAWSVLAPPITMKEELSHE